MWPRSLSHGYSRQSSIFHSTKGRNSFFLSTYMHLVFLIIKQYLFWLLCVLKKLRVFGCWDGYKWDDCSSEKQLWFRVRKHRSICVSSCDHIARGCAYKIVRMDGKLGFKIVDEDQEGALVAEIKQKQTTTGINLGNDVFTLTVQPHIDHTLIVAIVMVYGLINNQI